MKDSDSQVIERSAADEIEFHNDLSMRDYLEEHENRSLLPVENKEKKKLKSKESIKSASGAENYRKKQSLRNQSEVKEETEKASESLADDYVETPAFAMRANLAAPDFHSYEAWD